MREAQASGTPLMSTPSRHPILVWAKGPESLQRSPDEIYLWLAELDQPEGIFRALHATLTPEERRREACLRFASDRRRFAIGRGVLRDVLGRYAGVPPPGQIQFVQGFGEKPSLRCSSSLEFNLSHSKDVLLVVVANRRVGVDIEPVDDALVALDFVAEHLSELERQQLAKLPAHKRPAAKLRAWVCKEAYTKAIGVGLRAPLCRFSVCVDPDCPGSLRQPLCGETDSIWHMRTFRVDGPKPHAAAVCLEGEPPTAWRLWQWQPNASAGIAS